MKYKNKIFLQYFIGMVALFFLAACSNVIQQTKEKNREDYILSNPGVYDPIVPSSPDYWTEKFVFLEKYRVRHDWPYGFNSCKYSDEPPVKSSEILNSSVENLGIMFEYKGKTFQEASTVGYPKGTRTSRSKDRYVRTWKKIDGLGVERTHGYTPICWQPLGGSSHTLVVRLYKRSVTQWRKALQKSVPNGVFSMQQVGNNNWLTQEFDLKPSGLNLIAGKFKTWILPIGDTGYTYTFQLGASVESLKHPKTHETMKKIFKHLIESVKINPLSKEDAALASAKVKKLTNEIEAYEASRQNRN